jgi:hypothetical protein
MLSLIRTLIRDESSFESPVGRLVHASNANEIDALTLVSVYVG